MIAKKMLPAGYLMPAVTAEFYITYTDSMYSLQSILTSMIVSPYLTLIISSVT